jgi:hypothetical protein
MGFSRISSSLISSQSNRTEQTPNDLLNISKSPIFPANSSRTKDLYAEEATNLTRIGKEKKEVTLKIHRHFSQISSFLIFFISSEKSIDFSK